MSVELRSPTPTLPENIPNQLNQLEALDETELFVPDNSNLEQSIEQRFRFLVEHNLNAFDGGRYFGSIIAILKRPMPTVTD